MLEVQPEVPLDAYGRPEAIRTALTYGRLALFAGACAVYVVIRYIVFPRRRTRASLEALDDVEAER